MKCKTDPKILFFDLETAPELAFIWKRFKETVGQSQIAADMYLLCLAHTWNHDKKVECASIYGSKAWNNGQYDNDRNVVTTAWHLLNEADIVVGHNVRSFDVGTLNARFIKYGMIPPQPYKVVDTLEVLKKRARLPSNSLEASTHYFGFPDPKHKQTFELWRGCLAGDAKSWKNMMTYCKNDVSHVRELYDRLLPWIDNHPNMALYQADGGPLACKNCGGLDMERRGYARTSVGMYPRYQCQTCGAWNRGRFLDKDYDRSHVLQSAPVS